MEGIRFFSFLQLNNLLNFSYSLMKIHQKNAIDNINFNQSDELAKINGVSAVTVLEGIL